MLRRGSSEAAGRQRVRSTIGLVDGAAAAAGRAGGRLGPGRPRRPSRPPSRAGRDGEPVVEFSADQVSYDSEADIVTATGAVRMARDGNYLAADQVIWNRRTGEVRAEGNVVRASIPQGDKLVGDSVVLTDTLARRHDRESAGRARKRRPHRRRARHPRGRRHHARECGLFALPGDRRRPAARSSPSWTITAAG